MTLTLRNDIQDVPLLAAFIDEVCELLGFDMATTMQINLAMEEAVVNVMDYAYPDGKPGDVAIQAVTDNGFLVFTITDSGIPFDPTKSGEVDTTLSAEERRIGGLGIHLVRQLMDVVEYERREGRNILTLRKKM